MRQLTLPACLLASLAFTTAQITPVSNAAFYPYGPGTADILDPAADDGTSGEQSLSTQFPFFGNTYNSLYVNTNGAISFGGAVTGATTVAFPVTDNKVIAAFFTDIQTNHTGHIYHRETVDADVLARATIDIRTAFPADNGGFVATWTYIATWHEVGMKGATGDGLNLRSTFQLVLVTDGCKSFVLFNYDQIQFLQSGSSGGNGTNGTGPNPAQVGINGGDGTHYTIHPYSRTTNLYNLPTWTDPAVSGPAGRWYRRTDQALIGNTPALVCPSSYSQRRGEKCLKMFKKPTKSYTGAKATCASEGAELFIIRSHADTEWVVGMLADFNSRTGKKRDVWIGLTDEDTEGTFVWEDGTPFNVTGYAPWAEGAHEHNNEFRNCVFINKRKNWLWYVQKCRGPWELYAGPNSYICAKNAVPAAPDC
ncbi:sushi, nidogen and EGF-like domain-containing protein 1 isoform X1 [Branchiostoma floridae]|uniref:Sushi, nidogen and EGF-like domain-containing protein 1 isoform X1 n=1 Tax=Branchiostoma floridae TaxID=7739 RepID=A0A9J7HL29_BRAFL|nr:sushi, nidogen and EGF-like domain-containing protein 1 isoform X1 [Branchiostoma floridae]XP_035660240.1 sushi, nidogen and EGF-like domain-containing protein 1 isoform X1 [Branchiostoma floridae]